MMVVWSNIVGLWMDLTFLREINRIEKTQPKLFIYKWAVQPWDYSLDLKNKPNLIFRIRILKQGLK